MDRRRSLGAVYTPLGVAALLAEQALAGHAVSSVCDPAAGDGRLIDAVLTRTDAAGFAADLVPAEPVGLAAGAAWSTVDTLALGLDAWPGAPDAGFDLVIGNPPFRGQLRAETWLASADRARLKERFGEVSGSYTDTASLFLVAACEMAAVTGRVAMVMPLSFLAARDAGPARRRVLELASLEGLWVAPERLFPDAAVQVCAVILDRSGPRRRPLRRWVGAEFTPLPPVELDSDALRDRDSWSHLAAAAFGVPEMDLATGGDLGSMATATAGFRDQYYGLAPLVGEAPAERTDRQAPLVTSGLIEPGRVVWGARSTRVAKSSWRRPVVDLDALDAESPLGRWVAARRVPKVVVATQTRVVEAAVDPTGEWIPSTPVISVHADPDDLWRVLAVLCAPPISAWACTHVGGTALSADAVKLSASQVLSLPLPADHRRWAEAADRLRRAWSEDLGGVPATDLVAIAPTMTAAYGEGDEVTSWWVGRLPAP
ncbi:MAG: N-6 DNA methylase [Acidimicrobiales bacterium]